VPAVLADAGAGDLDEALLAVDHLRRRDAPFFEPGGAGDDLEGRARLVEVLDRMVAPRILREVAEAVRVEVGKRREREDRAAVRVHHDDRPARGAARLDRGGELGLGDVLDHLVDRQLDAHAVDRRVLSLAADEVDAASRVAEHGDLARAPAERRLERELGARKASAVDVDEAEDRCGEAPLRIGADVLLERVDAGELELSNLARDVVVDLARDPRELRIGLQLLLELHAREAEPLDRGELLRGVAAIGDRLRVGIDRVGRHALGEDATAVVEDRPAHGRELDRPLLLARRLHQIVVVAKDLHLRKPADDDDGPRREEGAEHEQALAAQRHRCTPGAGRLAGVETTTTREPSAG